MRYEKTYADLKKTKEQKEEIITDRFIYGVCLFTVIYFGGHVVYWFINK